MNSPDPESARLASGQSAASGNKKAASSFCRVTSAGPQSLPLNTVNQILTRAMRTLDVMEREARAHVEDLGVRWEAEIRELRREIEGLRRDVEQYMGRK